MPTNRMRWEILPASNWTNGFEGAFTNGNIVTNTWATNDTPIEREFLVRAWYNCDDDPIPSWSDDDEPVRNLDATVIWLDQIIVTHQDDGQTKEGLLTPGSFDAELKTIEPSTRTVLWTVIDDHIYPYSQAGGETFSASVSNDATVANKCNVTVTGDGEGRVELQAEDDELGAPCSYEVARIDVGCPCYTCPFGECEWYLGDVEMIFYLGNCAMWYEASSAGAGLIDPANLILPRSRYWKDEEISYTWDDMDITLDSDGVLQTMTLINPETEDDIGTVTVSGVIPSKGFTLTLTPKPTGSVVTHTFSDPDNNANPDNITKVEIVTEVDGEKWTNEYAWSSGSDVWTLNNGTAKKTVLTKETVGNQTHWT